MKQHIYIVYFLQVLIKRQKKVELKEDKSWFCSEGTQWHHDRLIGFQIQI